MTYTESNKSFVSSILEPYFRQAGVSMPREQFNKIVDIICKDDNLKNLDASNGHDYIMQKGLNMLREIQGKNIY